MSFPPPPTSSVDWASIGFKVHEVNGHVESKFSKSEGKWTEPVFVEDPYLRIHGMAPGINYGMQAFEGVKAFRLPSGKISVFRPDQNGLRMQHSATTLSMPPPPVEHFNRCVDLAVGLNAEYVPPHEAGSAMYIRPLLYGSSAQLGLNAPEEYTLVIYVMPTGVYHGVHPINALILEDFDRAAPFGTGTAKVGGNYGPVLRFSDKARDEGFGITLHLDSRSRTEVDEFSTSGFIGVLKGKGNGSVGPGEVTLVVPDSKQVIKSVTSESTIVIAEKLFGWKVERRSIRYEQLKDFDEVVAAGTAAALVPIKSITMRSRGDKFEYIDAASDEPGEVCVKLLGMLKGIQNGSEEDRFGWCHEVVKPTGYTTAKSLEGSDKERTNGVSADNPSKLL